MSDLISGFAAGLATLRSWVCEDCKNYWESVGMAEPGTCPSCSSANTRPYKDGDSREKSEAVFNVDKDGMPIAPKKGE